MYNFYTELIEQLHSTAREKLVLFLHTNSSEPGSMMQI